MLTCLTTKSRAKALILELLAGLSETSQEHDFWSEPKEPNTLGQQVVKDAWDEHMNDCFSQGHLASLFRAARAWKAALAEAENPINCVRVCTVFLWDLYGFCTG